MFNQSDQGLVIFMVICSVFMFLMITFVAIIIYRYQQKQNAYFKGIEEIKVAHENNMLQTKVEIQEQTFQNISQEIHDNIGQKLTLAKLQLNTLSYTDLEICQSQVAQAIKGISESIEDLSDLSRSMNSEIIHNNGFLGALEFEVNQLNKPGMYNMRLRVTGNSIYMDAQKELMLFRIVQESLHNVVKHAEATQIYIDIHFTSTHLELVVADNGKGFRQGMLQPGNGLGNMKKRATLLNGSFDIQSTPGKGTTITIQIPIYEQYEELLQSNIG